MSQCGKYAGRRIRVWCDTTRIQLCVVENTFIEVRIQLDIEQCAEAYDPSNSFLSS